MIADMPPRRSMPKLSPNEMSIMSVLWTLKGATSREILNRLPKRMALTTLLTYLSRLEGKSCVRHSGGDRNRTYSPAITRPSVASRLLDQLLGQFEGSLSSLVSHFTKTRKLSDEERRKLREILDKSDHAAEEDKS